MKYVVKAASGDGSTVELDPKQVIHTAWGVGCLRGSDSIFCVSKSALTASRFMDGDLSDSFEHRESVEFKSSVDGGKLAVILKMNYTGGDPRMSAVMEVSSVVFTAGEIRIDDIVATIDEESALGTVDGLFWSDVLICEAAHSQEMIATAAPQRTPIDLTGATREERLEKALKLAVFALNSVPNKKLPLGYTSYQLLSEIDKLLKQ